jgi:hypothetical protein
MENESKREYETTCPQKDEKVELSSARTGVQISCSNSIYRNGFMCAETRDKCKAAPDLLKQYRESN